LGKGYYVLGTSRNIGEATFANIDRLKIRHRIRLIEVCPKKYGDVVRVIKESAPSEIYFLSGQSSVGKSFREPIETIESTTVGMLNVLEASRLFGDNARVFHAGSSEVFGDFGSNVADEGTPFQPISPYGTAKASATYLVRNYRENFGLFACTGFLFNHESPLRQDRFVTQKIVSTAKRIANGSSELLPLGNLNIMRDWGWAPEYVEAMWLLLQNSGPRDYIIASGQSISLEEFVARVFSSLDLDWTKYVRHEDSLVRNNEIMLSKANPGAIFNELGWSAKTSIDGVIGNMLSDYLVGEKN
jgi:GDPmannose 4,6-dehydratase